MREDQDNAHDRRDTAEIVANSIRQQLLRIADEGRFTGSIQIHIRDGRATSGTAIVTTGRQDGWNFPRL